MNSLKDKVVLITGSSSGLGRGVALHFATCGSNLALNGRDIGRLEDVAHACQSKGLSPDHVLLVPGDLSDEQTTREVVEKTVQHYKRIDILVNNAGLLAWGDIQNTSLESYDKIMNINLRSVFHMTKLVIPHIIKTKGNIVNISSVNSLSVSPDVFAYSLAKAGVDLLTKCASLELAKHGVRVNAVNPGIIQTELFHNSGIFGERHEQMLAEHQKTHALGRVGKVDEVAKTVAFLASDDASFITGVLLPIDGGRSNMGPSQNLE